MNLILAVLATLRLTRFVTQDWLGEWWLVAPAKRWAGTYENLAIRRKQNQERSEFRRRQNQGIRSTYMLSDGTTTESPEEFAVDRYDENNPWSWQAKLVKGLDCPFCVGFWLGGFVLLTGVICTALGPIPRAAWRFVAGTFALNYVVGHVSSRIDG